ncbi:MAG: class I mannose-6-phosphate isomerase [Ignavibacteriaceae bacterium]
MKIPEIIILPPNRVWRTYQGGKILDSIEGKSDPDDSHLPEDWIASTTAAVNKGREEFNNEGLSQIEIDNSMIPLKELMEKFPHEIPGINHYKKYGANTQFLLKFLDSAIRLHIQVHPTIPFAQKYLKSNSGKTEAYVILNIREEITNPYIYLGFQKEISKKDFKKIIAEQNTNKLISCFEKIHVQPGDVFIVPGGLPHAIGEGIFMIEIMEPTDFVARLEFERGGYLLPEQARFMGRDIDFALNMINFTPLSVKKIKEKYFCYPRLINETPGGKEFILIDENHTKCFSVNKLIINESHAKISDSFYAGIVTKGSGKIITEHQQVKIKTGDKFFIPYKTKKAEYFADQGMEIILAFPPM